MDENDVIRFMGRFPDKIMCVEDFDFKSKAWKCSTCNTLFEFENEVDMPSPCGECGNIFFEKWFEVK